MLHETAEKNNLSFIETSALDSTNVENAFQLILTGRSLPYLTVKFAWHMELQTLLASKFYTLWIYRCIRSPVDAKV
jgi:hypothetical protein